MCSGAMMILKYPEIVPQYRNCISICFESWPLRVILSSEMYVYVLKAAGCFTELKHVSEWQVFMPKLLPERHQGFWLWMKMGGHGWKSWRVNIEVTPFLPAEFSNHWFVESTVIVWGLQLGRINCKPAARPTFCILQYCHRHRLKAVCECRTAPRLFKHHSSF